MRGTLSLQRPQDGFPRRKCRPSHRDVIVEFQSLALAKAAYEAPEYQEMLRLRQPHSDVSLPILEEGDHAGHRKRRRLGGNAYGILASLFLSLSRRVLSCSARRLVGFSSWAFSADLITAISSQASVSWRRKALPEQDRSENRPAAHNKEDLHLTPVFMRALPQDQS